MLGVMRGWDDCPLCQAEEVGVDSILCVSGGILVLVGALLYRRRRRLIGGILGAVGVVLAVIGD